MVLFRVGNDQVTAAELFGFVTGAASVWLTVRARISNFGVGIANSGFFLVVKRLDLTALVVGVTCDAPVDYGDPVIWTAQLAVIRAALDRDRRPAGGPGVGQPAAG